MTDTTTNATKIAELNDRLRAGDYSVGIWNKSQIVNGLSSEKQVDLFNQIQGFSEFTPGNNPHGERDFGSVFLGEEKYFWKIDYYDRDLVYGSEDPSNTKITKRVMTVMHSSEC